MLRLAIASGQVRVNFSVCRDSARRLMPGDFVCMSVISKRRVAGRAGRLRLSGLTRLGLHRSLSYSALRPGRLEPEMVRGPQKGVPAEFEVDFIGQNFFFLPKDDFSYM